MRIHECNVWCSEDDKAENLGLESGDIWIPISIDLDSVWAIKMAGENDFLGYGKATVYIGNERVTVDTSYEDLIRLWKYDSINS